MGVTGAGDVGDDLLRSIALCSRLIDVVHLSSPGYFPGDNILMTNTASSVVRLFHHERLVARVQFKNLEYGTEKTKIKNTEQKYTLCGGWYTK